MGNVLGIGETITNVLGLGETITNPSITFSCSICDAILFCHNDLVAHEQTHDSDFNPLLGHSYSIKPNKITIQFIAVNVCGLSSKMTNPDFMDQIKNYDIVSLSETKLDDADNPDISEEFSKHGFITFIKNRKNLTPRRSGGVLTAVKTELCHHVHRIECTEDFIIPLKLDKRLLDLDKDTIFITAYVPPCTSRYANIDHFTKISNTILDYDPDDFYHLLAGDLNAHTGLKSDLVTFDEALLRLLEIDEDTRARLEITGTMDTLGIPIERSSVDQKADSGNYGQALLDLCKNHFLCIFNSRAGSDMSIGKATTMEGSVIDYVIGSPSFSVKLNILMLMTLITCSQTNTAASNGALALITVAPISKKTILSSPLLKMTTPFGILLKPQTLYLTLIEGQSHT